MKSQYSCRLKTINGWKEVTLRIHANLKNPKEQINKMFLNEKVKSKFIWKISKGNNVDRIKKNYDKKQFVLPIVKHLLIY